MAIVATLRLRSPAFSDQEPIPRRHTGEGDDVSPELRWDTVPAAARSLALVCEDLDAPSGTFWHWLLYDMPPTLRHVAVGVPPDPVVPGIGRQGLNDFGKQGWNGPLPPPGSGPHRYVFTLYALSARPALEPGADRERFLAAIDGLVLQSEDITGVYERRSGRRAP